MDESSSRPSKGKEKAKEKYEEPGSQEDGGSLASRILDSASGLLNDITKGSNGELASTLASSSAIGGKSQGTSTSAGSSVWRENASAHSVQARSTSRHAQNPNISDSFRTLNVKAPVDPEMDAFMLDTTFSRHMTESGGEASESWSTQFNHATGFDSNGRLQSTNVEQSGQPIPEVDDGAEVAHLLSDPTIDAVDEMDMNMAQDLTQEQVNDLFPQDFTESEQRMVDQIKSNLPTPPTHKAMPFNHPLNLWASEAFYAEIQDLTASLESDLSSYLASSAVRERWLAEWDDVLKNYTDAVWGVLLPEVEKARRDLEELRQGGNTLDTKAVARLKMILSHVSQQGLPDVQPPSKRATGARSGDQDVPGKPEFHCPWATSHEVSKRLALQRTEEN